MRRLGQHFLKNKSAIQKIIAALELEGGETVVEIGPGHGELTLPLAEICQKIDCKIVAIEKDSILAKNLESRIWNLELQKRISVVRGDVLKILDSRFQIPNSYKLVGNIPYYITGHLLRIIGELENKPSLCVLTVQKEVAERIAAKPPKTNRLSASVQFWAEAKILGYISKKDFLPPPEVDSAIIRLETRKQKIENSSNYYKAVRILFAQPRQTILNNIHRSTKTAKKELAEKLKMLGIDPLVRPQNLSLEEIIKISGDNFFE